MPKILTPEERAERAKATAEKLKKYGEKMIREAREMVTQTEKLNKEIARKKRVRELIELGAMVKELSTKEELEKLLTLFKSNNQKLITSAQLGSTISQYYSNPEGVLSYLQSPQAKKSYRYQKVINNELKTFETQNIAEAQSGITHVVVLPLERKREKES